MEPEFNLTPPYPVIFFPDQKTFETWIDKNHATADGVWAKIAKKTSGIPSVDRHEALDIVLCYGWIDGLAKSIDDTYYVQKYTPRRAKSMWSKVNIAKVAALIEAGKMQPAGQAAIDAAKADGRWAQAYDPPSSITAPDDFKAALAASPKAKKMYESLNKTNVYAVLWRIQTAKRPETRLSRIQKLIAMLERGEKFH